MTGSATALGDLERRIRRLEAAEGIRATHARYCHAIDFGRHADWVDCFTPDAVWDVKERGSQVSGPLHGRAELAAYIPTHTHAPETWHKHLTFVTELELVTETEAETSSYFVRIEEGERAAVIGRYLDRLVRCSDGRWRFQERVASIEFYL